MSLPFSLDNAALMMSGYCIIASVCLSMCKQLLLLPVHFLICIPLREIIVIMRIWIRDVFFGALDAPRPSMYTPLWRAIKIYHPASKLVVTLAFKMSKLLPYSIWVLCCHKASQCFDLSFSFFLIERRLLDMFCRRYYQSLLPVFMGFASDAMHRRDLESSPVILSALYVQFILAP